MNQRSKRLLSILLSLVLLLGLMPGMSLTAYAGELSSEPVIITASNLTADGNPKQLINSVIWNGTNDLYLRVNSGEWVRYTATQDLTHSALKGTDAGRYYIYYYAGNYTPTAIDLGVLSCSVDIYPATVPAPVITPASDLTADGNPKQLIYSVIWNGTIDLYLRVNSGEWVLYTDHQDLTHWALKGTDAGSYDIYYYVGNLPPTLIDEGTLGCSVVINPATVAVTGVNLDKTDITIPVGSAEKLTATVIPGDATNKKVKWGVEGDAGIVALYYDEDCTQAVTLDAETDTLEVYAMGLAAGGAYSNRIYVTSVDGSKNVGCFVTVTEPAPAPANYLTFTGTGDFTLATSDGSKYWNGTLQYSTDASTWTEWNGETIDSGNKVLYLRGSGNTVITEYNPDACWTINTSGTVACSGDIRSLLDYENPEAASMDDFCFSYMFFNCRSLTSAPALPATTLAESCYESMFEYCTSLTAAPALPATTLARYCYYNMFANCTSLTTAPVLPATTLDYGCYSSMFFNCTSLTTAPALPATTLARNCYESMFRDCRSLTTAPALPATTLARNCYYRMFKGCTGIKLSAEQTTEYNTEYRIPKEGTGTPADNALNDMFAGTGGTFTGTPDINTTYYVKGSAPAPSASIDFLGGGLQRRVYSGTTNVVDFETNIRFGFAFTLPEGAEIDTNASYFRWKLYEAASADSGNKIDIKNIDNSGDKPVAHMIVTGVPKAYYTADFYCFVHLEYSLNGTNYVLESGADGAHVRSVKTVCEKLIADPNAQPVWKEYAQRLIDAIPA